MLRAKQTLKKDENAKYEAMREIEALKCEAMQEIYGLQNLNLGEAHTQEGCGKDWVLF